MPLYIRDGETARLVAELAKERGISKTGAVRMAVQAELRRTRVATPLRERIVAWRAEHKLPQPTGKAADKAFFDDLSGEL
ncbi:MAG: type II toxin-antitoxin system VapB family antitoxin [Acetobacteraceae bacterium]